MTQLTWLITGCSSGFGREFVSQIIARGDRVVATGRQLEKLRTLEQVGVAILELDVTDKQPSINNVINNAVALYGHIDILVNNAGFVTSGSWEDLEYDDFLASFDTNVFGPIKVTKAILPHFRMRKAGTLVFIGSLSGWIGHGFNGAYAGSKFALEGVVESLSHEVAPFGIKTLLLEPGTFRTNLFSEGSLKANRSVVDDYKQASNDLNDFLKQFDSKQPGDPKKFVSLVIDLVREEGAARDKKIPFRLPVGEDCVLEIRQKLNGITDVMNEWDAVIKSTTY